MVVRVRRADEETFMSVSVSVPHETLTSEKPWVNVAAMLMMNVLNVRSVSDMENRRVCREVWPVPMETVAFCVSPVQEVMRMEQGSV